MPPPDAASGCGGGWDTVFAEARSAGATSAALVLSWRSVAPRPGTLDEKGLEECRGLLEQCHRAGLEPLVAFDQRLGPRWGGPELWLTPGAPEAFGSAFTEVVEAVGDRCRWWVPVLEPGRFARQGWVVAERPPKRLLAVADAFVVLDNLAVAFAMGLEVVRGRHRGALVLASYRRGDTYDEGPLVVDLAGATGGRRERQSFLAARRRRYRRARRDPLVALASGALSPWGAHDPVARASPGDAARRPGPLRSLGVAPTGGGPDAVLVTAAGSGGARGPSETLSGAESGRWLRREQELLGRPVWVLAGSWPDAPDRPVLAAVGTRVGDGPKAETVRFRSL